MSDQFVAIEVPAEGVGLVTLLCPPVNALGTPVRRQLIRAMDELQDREDVRAIVLTGTAACSRLVRTSRKRQRLPTRVPQRSEQRTG